VCRMVSLSASATRSSTTSQNGTRVKKHKEIGDALEGRFEPNPFTNPNDAFSPKNMWGTGARNGPFNRVWLS